MGLARWMRVNPVVVKVGDGRAGSGGKAGARAGDSDGGGGL